MSRKDRTMRERYSEITNTPTPYPSAAHTQRLSRHSLLMTGIALLALALVGTLAGCDIGAPSGATKATLTTTARTAQAATATQAAQATQAAEPTGTTISIQQEGTIAQNNISLHIAVTVTNRTTAPIHIYFTCGYAPVIVQVFPVNGLGILWTQDTVGCPSHSTLEDPNMISPGAAYTFTYTAPLSQYGAEIGHGGFHPGDYQVNAKYSWHQGTLDQLGTNPPSVRYGKATGETTITIR